MNEDRLIKRRDVENIASKSGEEADMLDWCLHVSSLQACKWLCSDFENEWRNV